MSFEYGIFTADDSPAVIRILADVFTRKDPLATAVGVTEPDFQTFARLLCPKAAAEGLTIVARHAATREIAGVMLTEDSASPMPDGFDTLSPNFSPIFEFLHNLEVEYRAGRDPRPGEWLHLFLLGVAESYGGRGIAQQLVSTCLENGARRGYRLAVTEATNPTSQHIFRKLGFADRARRSYADSAPFAPVAWAGGTILMDRSL